MRRVKVLRDWLLLLTLGCAAATPLRAENAPAAPQPLARSSLLTLEGANTPAGLMLRVRPNSGTTPLTVSEFSVLLDGKSVPAAARPDGTWLVPLPAPAAGGQLDVAVTHDGIRELLSAKLPAAHAGAAAPAAGTGATGVHKQIVWWILNVLIVLVAAIAISRRTS
jgi:hypothetical protein